ncbi:MAG: hypothetical protein JSW65_07505 [Candidatus Bipolaricaulota bacterium]|nr:MAG: hypothetical protein JSW65_07505 [Candidatus Bipolaricaulota bacterium]
MRRTLFAVLLLVLVASLTSCVGLFAPKDEPEGIVRVTIAPPSAAPQSVGPKLIPPAAEKVRIRVWHPVSEYNHVTTVPLLNGPQTVNIPVPEGNGYYVDAVSYKMNSMPLALTGGRTTGVAVYEDEVTTAAVELYEWGVNVDGPDTVRPDTEYTLDFEATDAGGLITRQTFDTATLRASTIWFEDPMFPLPPISGPVVAAEDDGIRLTGTTPDVTVPTTMYALALVQFRQQWYDYDLPEPSERPMFLELPNRHMNGTLYEFEVDPTAGGLEVEISGE